MSTERSSTDHFPLPSRVHEARVATLATADADGVPHLVPIVFAVPTPDSLVTAVDHKPKSTHNLKRLRNISQRPEVSVLVHHYEDDWSTLWWVRIDGVARIHTEGTARKRLIGSLISKYPQYADHPPDGPVVAITVSDVRSWAATS